MINTETVIYMDTLGLLMSEKTDIRAEVYNNFCQGDDYVFDKIKDEIMALADEKGDDVDAAMRAFEDADIKTIMNYISVDEEGIAFDYDESVNCGNRRTAAFAIPIKFDEEKFYKSDFFRNKMEEFEEDRSAPEI